MDVSDIERELMLKQYHQECKKIRDNFDTKYQSCFYLQSYYRDYIKANNLSIENGTLRPWVKECLDKNGDFSGELFAMSRCKDDYNALAKKYEKYLTLNPNKHRWIMISPVPLDNSPDCAFKMIDLYKKLCSLKIDNYIACVEGHVSDGYRPHIHMILFDLKTRPNRIIEKLAKHFSCAKNFIQCKNSTEFERNFNYIKGIKQIDKMPRVKLDREERLRDGIPDYLDKR
jgi:hypothetical protein